MGSIHRPVLANEILTWLAPRAGSIVVDGTVGGGGHAALLASRLLPTGRLIGLDRDPAMLNLAREAVMGLPVSLYLSSYRDVKRALEELGIDQVQGVLLDLGLSSDQLGWSNRGFSFVVDGALDMRFDPNSLTPSAEDLVNQLTAEELARIFFEYGEERFCRQIARGIVEARQREPIRTTTQLADLIRRCMPRLTRNGSIDPATRVFQALRIAVNDELEQLTTALGQIPDILAPGGRFAVISFHSLEDRRVKYAFKTDARLNVLTKKPLTASAHELAVNPRSRSAKLRVAERCPI
jgi:16S rRNA (cytosine1402-N4)-methyltransferase